MIYFHRDGQRLIKLNINNKPSDWAISNNGGKWQMYKMNTKIRTTVDLAKYIHDDKMLDYKVWDIVSYVETAIFLFKNDCFTDLCQMLRKISEIDLEPLVEDILTILRDKFGEERVNEHILPMEA
tara:strand:- start:70 stop:444 length:375 start_codon:yes stop_codon:yes gene_type:complete